MDFTFSAEQEALRDSVRAFLADRAPREYVRQMAEHDAVGVTPEVWQAVVDLGWTGVLVPTAAGGLGLGLVDMVVVAEEMGRALFPGPFFSSAVLATLAARALGLDDLLAELAVGAARGTVALDESGHGDPLERVRLRAIGRGERYRLAGTAPMVLDGASADWALVPARTREGLRTFLVGAPGARAAAAPSLDITRRFARLGLDDAAVLLAAEMIGVAEAANALALDYAQAREVFGKPLSKFQVTRHKAVDLLREIEIARVAVHYAAWASDAEVPDR
ncbi:MAG: acyl-CoA dehydrogenase family protein, partial [Actinomycetota bacterium]